MPLFLDRYALTTKRGPFNGSHPDRKRTGESRKSTAVFPHLYFSERLTRSTWPLRAKTTFGTFIQTTRTFWLPLHTLELKGKTQSVDLPRLSLANCSFAAADTDCRCRVKISTRVGKRCDILKHARSNQIFRPEAWSPSLFCKRRLINYL